MNPHLVTVALTVVLFVLASIVGLVEGARERDAAPEEAEGRR
jgi:hypothetical protein